MYLRRKASSVAFIRNRKISYFLDQDKIFSCINQSWWQKYNNVRKWALCVLLFDSALVGDRVLG